MKIRSFRPEDEDAVIALWEECRLTRPWNDPRKDIQRKGTVQPEWFLIGTIEEQIVATVMAGYDGHRGSVYYLAVSPQHQRKGLGQEMMREVERLLKEAGCPKLNLLVRQSNTSVVQFYESLGYITDEVICLSHRLIPDEPGAE